MMQPFRKIPRPNGGFTKVVIWFGVFALLGVLSAAAYQSQPEPKKDQALNPSQQFIGTWQAELKGRPYFIVYIESITPKIVGSFSAAPGLNVSPNGEVTNIWSDAKLSDAHSMIEPKLDGKRLSFQYKSEEGDEQADSFEMVLINPDEATLRLTKTFDNQEGKFLSDEEIAKSMKPSHMKKVDNAAKKEQ